MFRGLSNRRALESLLATRIVYAINWYCISAVFPLMALDFDQNASGLALITAAFYVGIVAFQVPAGFVSSRIGARRTAILGTAVSSLANLLIAVVPGFGPVIFLRFLVGMGMACVYSPSVTLVMRYYKRGGEGVGFGLYNASYNIGASIGLWGWAVLGQSLGWRIGMGAAGILGLVSTLALLLTLPRDDTMDTFALEFSKVRRILFDRQLILVSVVLLGVNGSTLFSSFIIYFLHSQEGLSLGVAGLVGALNTLVGLFGGPLGGRLYDKEGGSKSFLLLMGVAIGTGLCITPFALAGAVTSAIIVGISSGMGFTFGFIIAREMRQFETSYRTIVVSWVNAISLVSGFVLPGIFSAVILGSGWLAAWILGGLLTMALTLPALGLKTVERVPEKGSLGKKKE